MFSSIRNWKRKRKETRRRQRLNDPASYPADMDRQIVSTIIRVKDFTMTSVERIHGLCEAVRYLETAGIEGDFVECGVWRGGSMMAVAETLRQLSSENRHLHLFDTFSGMNDPTEKDVSCHGQPAAELLQSQSKSDPTSVWCVSGLDEVRLNLASTGYPAENIHYHAGMVEETIPTAEPEKIALLRLDTDWYESTRHELVHLFPRLSDGGVLIIDDYGHWQGARRAVDEYFEQHGVGMMLHRLDYTGRIGIRHAAIERAGRQGNQKAA